MTTEGLVRRGRTSRDLYKAIFDAPQPEQQIRTIPAQSLYLIIRQRGLQSATDLIEIATVEQCRLLLDLDLWEKDQFREDNLWEWLSLSDEEDPLTFTQKLLKSIDLKLISLLISRYVLTKVFDEPTDNPPSAGWFTPDKGHTWIKVNTDHGDRFFFLNRLLALIFETSAELFYQLLSIPGVSTEAQLEEESLADKTRRLAAEGVPDFDVCAEINSSLMPFQVKKLLEKREKHPVISDIPIIEPLLYDSIGKLEPLDSSLAETPDREGTEGELTLIMNASIEFFSVPFFDYEAVQRHVKRVKGALNIGLQKAMTLAPMSGKEAIEYLGLTKLYRLGLHELRALRKEALQVPLDEAKAIAEDQKKFSLLAHVRLPFPEMPSFLDEQEDTERSNPHGRAIVKLEEVTELRKQISAL